MMQPFSAATQQLHAGFSCLRPVDGHVMYLAASQYKGQIFPSVLCMDPITKNPAQFREEKK
jgi:hypothetical protein